MAKRSPAPDGAADTDNALAQPSKAKSLRPLRMIWRQALNYPWMILGALLALTVTASATLAIPSGFKLIIDKGFGEQGGDISEVARWFRYLMMIIGVMA